MRERHFARPTFLRPETEPVPPPDQETGAADFFKEGGNVVVADLNRLPKEMRRRVPDGYVLKKYKFDEYSPHWHTLIGNHSSDVSRIMQADVYDAFTDAYRQLGYRPDDDEIIEQMTAGERKRCDRKTLKKVLKEFSLEENAKKLKQQNDTVRNFFSEELPNIIVPTQFIVGAEENLLHPHKDGVKHIYELQPKIEDVPFLEDDEVHQYVWNHNFYNDNDLVPEHIKNIAQQWAWLIKNRLPKNYKKIKNELQNFIRIARGIPDKSHHIPFDMVHPYNIRFTTKGIRIIDINKVILKTGTNPVEENTYLQRYNRFLDIWQLVCDEL